VAKDLDSMLFRAWLRYLKAETAEEDELPAKKPDRSNYRDVTYEVPVLFTLDREKEWASCLKQTIFDCDFVLESCWTE
jgi:predicted alpha/beta hydrolase